MKYQKIIFLIILTTLVCISYIKAQPFIFTSGKDIIYDTLSGERSYTIYKINLSNGLKESIGEGGPNIFWDNTQSWVVNGYDHYSVMGVANDKFLMPSVDPYFNSVDYSMNSNKLYIIGKNTENDDDATERDAFTVINTVNGNTELLLNIQAVMYAQDHQMFFSADNSKLYFMFYDTVLIPVRNNRIKVAALSTSTDRIIQTKNLQDLGYPGADGYSLQEGKGGKAIISCGYMQNLINHYNIYDFDNDSSSSFITYDGTADPFFTNNGKYLVLAERYHNSGEIQDISGKFYVYNVQQQKLVKTLQLPPKRLVYTFDNFPDNIYYYNDSTETAITLNIDSLVNNSPSVSEITPAITFPGTQNFNLELKGSKFTNNSIVLWNGNERTTTLVSDSILHAVINATDISLRGNYRVTVKSGFYISDALMFAVVDSLTMPVHPILECVHDNGNSTYSAHFGYQNDLDKTVLVPIGGQNSFSPGQPDRGQTTIFYPGRHTDVFIVNFDGSNISWILDMQMKAASSSSPPCN